MTNELIGKYARELGNLSEYDITDHIIDVLTRLLSEYDAQRGLDVERVWDSLVNDHNQQKFGDPTAHDYPEEVIINKSQLAAALQAATDEDIEVYKKHPPEYWMSANVCYSLIARIEQLQNAINSFGNNPNGFDWAVLDKLDEQEQEIEQLRAAISSDFIETVLRYQGAVDGHFKNDLPKEINERDTELCAALAVLSNGCFGERVE